MVSTAKGGICDCFQSPGVEASEIGSGKRLYIWHERARGRTGARVDPGGNGPFDSDVDTTSTSTFTYFLLYVLHTNGLIAIKSY